MPLPLTQPVYSPVPGYPAESIWAMAVAERVIQAFATVAARDSQWTAPPQGSVCVTLDTDTFWYRTTTAWVSLTQTLKICTYGQLKAACA